MGSAADSWKGFSDRNDVRGHKDGPLGELVEVAALLRGKPKADGTGWERPPLALKLWLAGSLLKFVFSSDDFPLCLWGSTKAIETGLLGVEEALCRENFDWRENKWYKNGFTKHRQ